MYGICSRYWQSIDNDTTRSIIFAPEGFMARADKRLQKMRQNPRDWRVEDIQSVADSLGIEWLHDGGSHVIMKLLALAASVKEANDERSEE